MAEGQADAYPIPFVTLRKESSGASPVLVHKYASMHVGTVSKEADVTIVTILLIPKQQRHTATGF